MDELNKRKDRDFKSIVMWTLAILLALLMTVVSLVPFGFMIVNSFKDKFELLQKGVFAWPESLKLANYQEVLAGNFLSYFFNSVVVLVVSLFLLLLIAAFAAYPLSRLNFKFNQPIYAIIVACMTIPVHITLIPVFKMSQSLHIYDSIWALIGPNVAMGLPISVFVLTTFMQAIPQETEEAAEIDGCNKIQIFFKIILPMAKPGLSTIAIYNGVTIWNEFSFAYTLTQNARNRTLPLAIWEFQGQYSMNAPLIMAVLTLTVLPMIVLFMFAQERLIKGMAAGAVKG